MAALMVCQFNHKISTSEIHWQSKHEDPMIELIPNLPDSVVGLTASGKVTAEDYETVVIPAVESALKKHSKVRLLYQVGPAFTGFALGAMWDDMKVGIGHFRAWEKIAMVTDVEWLAGTARFFGFMMPCPVRVFAIKEYGEAALWIAEP
jgi:hypothetical protein